MHKVSRHYGYAQRQAAILTINFVEAIQVVNSGPKHSAHFNSWLAQRYIL
jgi:hypothetical protein